MIWLPGKSIADVVRICLPAVHGRFQHPPNRDNEVYVIEKFVWHYELASANPVPGRVDISDQVGCIRKETHFFNDVNRTRQRFDYWLINVWDAVPPEFRDVVLFHEVVEGQGVADGKKQPMMHQIAVTMENQYLKEYFSPAECVRYRRCIDALLKTPQK